MVVIKAVKWLVIVFLLGIVVAELILILNHELTFKRSHTILLFTMIWLFYYRSKLSWALMILLCIIGVVNIVLYSANSSVPTIMDFLGSIRQSLNEQEPIWIKRTISIFPFFFYVITLSLFCLKPVRRVYKLNR
jgi:hypothetical protein